LTIRREQTYQGGNGMNNKNPILIPLIVTVFILTGGVTHHLFAHGEPHSKQDLKLFQMAYKKAVDKGYKIFHDASLGTTGQSCDMCHPDASNTHPETYPKYQTQIKRVIGLRDMINWCILNPLKGEELAADSDEMIALEAYITDQRKGAALDGGKH